MSHQAVNPMKVEQWRFWKGVPAYAVVAPLAAAFALLVVWRPVRTQLFAADYVPHFYCYLGKPGLVWTHTIADSLIALAYFAISGTLLYLVYRGRRYIPFQWIFLAFGLFIVACGATHLVDTVTVWIPVYVLSAGVKVFTAVASLATAVMLPFAVPSVLTVVQSAQASELSNERLRMALECSKSVGWDRDLKSGEDMWFGDLPTMFGIPANSYAGRLQHFYDYVHPEDRKQVSDTVHDALIQRKPYFAEFRIVRADGNQRWVVSRGIFRYSSEGQPERTVGMAVDITEKKSAEEALRRKEMELTEAQHLAGVGNWRWRPEGDVVTWSEQLYRIAGRDPGLPAVSYQDQRQLYTPESWKRLSAVVEEALRSGTAYELDVEMVRPDGTKRWITARGEAERDAAGRIVGLRGTAHDITERKRTQEELRESEERLRLAAEAGRMFAYCWDAATDVIERSGESARILGIPETTTLTGQQALAQVHGDDLERLKAAIAALSPEKPRLQIVYRMIRPDGSLIWLERHSCAYFDEQGRILRLVGMVADIGERKRAEEVLATMNRRLIEAQDAERARIARDLHDDLGQRLALLALTLEHVKRPRGSTAESDRAITEMDNQILEILSGLQAWTHELHPSRLEHLGLVAAVRGFCRDISEKRAAEVEFRHQDVPAQVPREISLCLFRVLQEALHNAVKHSGVRRFEVELRGTADAIYLTVRDRGAGFDPKTAINGNGLGLTSMQERLKLVQGELAVESQLEQGTTIAARVPFLSRGNELPAAG